MHWQLFTNSDPKNTLGWSLEDQNSDIGTWSEVALNEEGLITALNVHGKYDQPCRWGRESVILEYLYVYLNQLDSWLDLSTLEELWVFNNPLTSLSECIGSCPLWKCYTFAIKDRPRYQRASVSCILWYHYELLWHERMQCIVKACYIPNDWLSIDASSTTFSYSSAVRSLKK